MKFIIKSALFLFILFSLNSTTFQNERPKVGDMAREIELPNTKGKIIKLSDLRGKYVFLDFWASWCGPCRKENPNVVSAYEKYKNAEFKDGKGFEVYSVSLDRSKSQWISAIKMDQLNWKHNVSDLKKWKSIGAETYGISFIPYNFLIDPNGKIIGRNLKGMALHLELDKYIEKL